jgi:hypothetical protein
MSDYVYDELNREARIGGMGEAKDYGVALIDLSDYDTRKAEIADANCGRRPRRWACSS